MNNVYERAARMLGVGQKAPRRHKALRVLAFIVSRLQRRPTRKVA